MIQADTIIVLVLAVSLAASAPPVNSGLVEFNGFPLAYLFAATLLIYGVSMRKRILHEGSVAETVSLRQVRYWSQNNLETGKAQEERMRA